MLRVARQYTGVAYHDGEWLGVRPTGEVDRLTHAGQGVATGLTLPANSRLFSIDAGLFACSANRIDKLADDGASTLWSKTAVGLGTITGLLDHLGSVVAGTATDVVALDKSQLTGAAAPASITKSTILPTGNYPPIARAGDLILSIPSSGPPVPATISPGVGLFLGQAVADLKPTPSAFGSIVAVDGDAPDCIYVVESKVAETRIRQFNAVYLYLPVVTHPIVTRSNQDVHTNSAGQVLAIVNRGGLGFLRTSASYPQHAGSPGLYLALSGFINSISNAAVECEVPLPREILPASFPLEGVATTARGYDADAGGRYYAVATNSAQYFMPGTILRTVGDEGRAFVVTGQMAKSGAVWVFVDPPVLYLTLPRLYLATTLRCRMRPTTLPAEIAHDPFLGTIGEWQVMFDEKVTA